MSQVSLDPNLKSQIALFIESYFQAHPEVFKGKTGDQGPGLELDEEDFELEVDKCLTRLNRRGRFFVGGTPSVGDPALRTDLATANTTNGGALVAFLPSGTGAVTRTMQAKQRDMVSTADYGTLAQFNTARAALTGTLGVPPSMQFSNFSSSAAAPWALINGGSTFNGTYDPAFYIAYNVTSTQANTRINTAEPYLKFGFEADYNNSVAHLMELNLDYTSADGVSAIDKRFLAFGVDRSTHNGVWALAGTTIRLESAMNNGEVTITTATGVVQTNGQFTRSKADGNVSTPVRSIFLSNTDGSNSGVTSPSIDFDVGGGGGRAQIYTKRLAGSGGQLYISTDNTSGVSTIAFAVDEAGQTYSAAGHLAAYNTAIPAGGTAGLGYKLSTTSNFGVFFGSGAPTLSAAKGSLYLRSDGSGTADRAYINTNGAGTWTALTTVA